MHITVICDTILETATHTTTVSFLLPQYT